MVELRFQLHGVLGILRTRSTLWFWGKWKSYAPKRQACCGSFYTTNNA